MEMLWLSWHDAIDCVNYVILVLPKEMMPRGFAISLNGVPVPPLPVSKDFGHEVFHHMQKKALWLGPKYNADNGYWLTLFHVERETTLHRFTGGHPPQEENMF
jgi:hypothetical protein